MKINQQTNGNILVQDLKNNFIALMPKVFVFPHPRKENAIILNCTGINDDVNSIEGNLDQGIYVNGNRFSNLDSLINEIQKEIVLNGNKISSSTDSSSDTPQEPTPNKAMFESITDYETMYLFTKEHTKTVSPVKIDSSGRINEEEYILQFSDLVARITLTYYYIVGDQISHILMNGTTGNISLPLKTYMYNGNNEITHTYELATWRRHTNL